MDRDLTSPATTNRDPLTALPCPFCGETPALSIDEYGTTIECTVTWCVRPSWCDEAAYDGDDEHAMRALARWNERVQP